MTDDDDDDDRRIDLVSRRRVVALEARYRKVAVTLYVAIGVLGLAVTGAVIGLFSLIDDQHDSRVRALTAVCLSTNRTNEGIVTFVAQVAPNLSPQVARQFPVTRDCRAVAAKLAN